MVAELIRIKMQVEIVTSWMAVEREKEEEKKSMIIVVPSCLKDTDGARTRSDQKAWRLLMLAVWQHLNLRGFIVVIDKMSDFAQYLYFLWKLLNSKYDLDSML